jgi:hypothetical protein
MAARGRKNADEALLLALACGATVENAARKAGVSERTVRRRLADPAFKKRLDAIRGDMVQRAMGMLTAAAMEAVKTLVALQDKEQPAASRLGAARAILEYGAKLREEADLTKRVEALEEQLDPDKGKRSA